MARREQAAERDQSAAVEDLFLLRLRYREGRLLEVGGNRPFLLDDRDAVWVVYAGVLDIFSVPVRDGRSQGARHHLMHLSAGQACFGMDSSAAPDGIGLLAVGGVGASIVRVRRARLLALTGDPLHAATALTLIDDWVQNLSLGVIPGIPPKDPLILTTGAEVALGNHAIARADRGVLWVSAVAGACTFLGRPELPLAPGAAELPLTKWTWVEAAQSSALACADTAALLAHDPALASLDRFHAVILDCVAARLRRLEQAERERLARSVQTDDALIAGDLARIAALLEPRAGAARPPDEQADPLLAACRLVGAAQGITIKAAATAGAARDPLQSIAHASHIRIRRVTLADEWWRRDGGPLLGYLAEERRPVALIPSSPRRYRLVDPLDRRATPVTAARAATLEPEAYVLYRPFPARSLTALDVFTFGLRGSRRDLVMLLLMGTAGGVLALVIPLATATLFNTIIPSGDRTQLVQIAAALVVVAIAGSLFELTRSFALLRLEGKMDGSVQAAVWDRLLALPTPFFRQFTAGDLATRAMGINAIRSLLTGATVNALLGIVFSVFSFLLLFHYDVRLALVATALVVAIIGVTAQASRLQLRHQRKLQTAVSELSGLVLQLIGGVAKLRVAGAERRAFSLWATAFTAQRRLSVQVSTIGNGLAVFRSVSPILTSMAIFATIALSSGVHLSAGDFLAFNAAFAQFLAAMLAMNGAGTALLHVVPIFENVKPILESVPEADPTKADPGELSGAIEISHVSFRYAPDGPAVLSDVSLRINPGELVAIVGPSGSGKSSLFRLLLGFEQPEAGTIFYDGQSLAGLDLQAVRRQLGVVLQAGKLMPGDIFSNIVGSSPLTLDDAWEAARMVGLDDDIRQMPMGMHTSVSEDGSTFSGGQRQRLMIARALVTRPRILLFDEATSALDNQTQETVTRSLAGLQATRIVIAHRLSTIMNADRIFVLMGGKIVQSGTYEHLLTVQGPFADLAKRQLA